MGVGDFEGCNDGFVGDGVCCGDSVKAWCAGCEMRLIAFYLKGFRVPCDRIFAFALQRNPSTGREGLVDEKNSTFLGGQHAEPFGRFCVKLLLVRLCFQPMIENWAEDASSV